MAKVKLSEGELKWLRRLAGATNGQWPDRPFIHDRENSTPLMQKGLVEVVKPSGQAMPYAQITPSGRALLEGNDNG